MAIKFLNIRSKEIVVADSEPKIAALWSSSDRSPNITQGQDFGWRLAPEVVVEMKKIKQDYQKLETIAVAYNKMVSDVGEPDILQWISDHTRDEQAPTPDEQDYTDDYNEQIRQLETTEETTTKTTTKSK